MGPTLVDADWSVELAADDPALELPWMSPDGSQRYVDLIQHPGATDEIVEARRFAQLQEFLKAINCVHSPWMTVKCDAWLDEAGTDAESTDSGQMRMGCYVDIVRRLPPERFSLQQHEHCVKAAAATLQSSDDNNVRCEFVVRRCFYHLDLRPENDSEPGFYVTAYVFGFGHDENEAVASWAGGLTRVSYALTE